LYCYAEAKASADDVMRQELAAAEDARVGLLHSCCIQLTRSA
jgi:hypothetical protein